ncbi:MAG: hypothetical protein IMF01_03090 [Proteobacteria bacterium]|nr:hypothetical protein [Pseudomonadota bacterium]
MRKNYDSPSIYKKIVKIFNLNVRSLEKSSSLLSSTIVWISAQAIVNSVEPKDEFAGLVGGIIFGPEMKGGRLTIGPIASKGRKRITFARK